MVGNFSMGSKKKKKKPLRGVVPGSSKFARISARALSGSSKEPPFVGLSNALSLLPSSSEVVVASSLSTQVSPDPNLGLDSASVSVPDSDLQSETVNPSAITVVGPSSSVAFAAVPLSSANQAVVGCSLPIIEGSSSDVVLSNVSAPISGSLPDTVAGTSSGDTVAGTSSGDTVAGTSSGDTVSPTTRTYSAVARDPACLEEIGSPTQHISGAPFVFIPDENIQAAKEEFKDFVFAQFHGPIPAMGRIIGVVNAIWARSGPRIFVHRIGDGTFLLKVISPRVRETILSRNMWSIVGHPMFVAPWSPDFNPDTPLISSAVVTVELRGVPYLLFNKESLGRIATAVGKPVALAPETARKENFEVAKLLVRVNLLKELPSRVVSGFSDGREIDIDVSYPWLPPKCNVCDQFGHATSLCRQYTPSTSGRKVTKRSASRRGRPSRRERLSRKVSRSRVGRSITANAEEKIPIGTIVVNPIIDVESAVGPISQQPVLLVSSPTESSRNNVTEEAEPPFIMVSRRRQTMTKDWINICKPLFGAFLETHIREVNSRRIVNAIPSGWKSFGNFGHHNSARIVVVWDPRISLVVYQSSAQMVTCGVFLPADNSWQCNQVSGSNQFKVLKSLKALKPALRRLNKRHFSGISQRVKIVESQLDELHRTILSAPTPELAREEHLIRAKWRLLSKAEEKFYRQRSRVKWMHLGDRNTEFFHKTVSVRLNRNHIHFLQDQSGRRISGDSDLKSHAAAYFEEILGTTSMPESPCSTSVLADLLSFRCSDIHKLSLIKAVSDEEITSTVFALPLDKCPGPDGFSVEFFRASWSIVGSDIVAAVQEFFRNGRLLKDFNTTKIALIPKFPEACKLGDYRPISCCNLVYKIISKIIANRLKPILQECVSLNQAAFLKGRLLGENVLLASELIRHYQQSSCPKSSMLKVDIKKAFDTVCWDFILKLLAAQEFPPLFCIWIKECISSPRFSVAINGELAGFFAGKKGLRQGDPLSPYLFIMVMQALSKLLENAADRGQIELHPKCLTPRITYLLFADDLLVFSNGSRVSLAGVAEVMTTFKEISGLDMNPSKSEIFFGGYPEAEVRELCAFAGINLGSFPTRYLGLPLNPTRISFATLQPFLERITSKLHSWTAKFLSFAGKIRLVSSVIYGMVNFWSSVFVLPKRFYAKIDSLCAAFLWNNKTGSASGARVAWKDLCKPKCEGGLGIRLLEDFEIVFRLKLIWQFFSNSGSLWVAWLKGNIFSRKSYWITVEANRLSKTVNSLLQLKPTVTMLLKCVVGDGQSASFWYDTWTDFGQLITFLGEAGPRQLRIRKDAHVVEASRNGDWELPAARSENSQAFMIALTELGAPNVNNGRDSYLWRNASGNFCPSFSSKETWEQLRIHSPQVPWSEVVWFKEHVPRFSFITWLAMLARLPTRDRLRRWGMNIPASCVLCSNGEESHEHLFFRCQFSSEIWGCLAAKFLPNPPGSLAAASSWIILHNQPHNAKIITILKLLLQSAVYHLWKERNFRIFNAIESTAAATRLAIDRTMRNRLVSFPGTTLLSPSLLQVYFSHLSFP
ncbi:unnamed protein product, partial [Arabidopsis lyrata]